MVNLNLKINLISEKEKFKTLFQKKKNPKTLHWEIIIVQHFYCRITYQGTTPTKKTSNNHQKKEVPGEKIFTVDQRYRENYQSRLNYPWNTIVHGEIRREHPVILLNLNCMCPKHVRRRYGRRSVGAIGRRSLGSRSTSTVHRIKIKC